MFPYYGPIQELETVLNRMRTQLTQIYKDLLGAEMFGVVERADQALLGEGSFLSMADLETGETSPATRNNKFLFAHTCDEPVFEPDGTFTLPDTMVRMAPGFVFTEDGFALTEHLYRPWVSPYLAPYVHEYNHFVIFALQDIPMMLASYLLQAQIRPRRLPIELPDIESLVNAREGSIAEKKLWAMLALQAINTDDHFETSTRALDYQVFRRLGYKVPYQLPSKHYTTLMIPSIKLVGVVGQGDPLEGKSTRERLRTMRDWVEIARPIEPIHARFMQSLKGLKRSVQKISYSEMQADEQ